MYYKTNLKFLSCSSLARYFISNSRSPRPDGISTQLLRDDKSTSDEHYNFFLSAKKNRPFIIFHSGSSCVILRFERPLYKNGRFFHASVNPYIFVLSLRVEFHNESQYTQVFLVYIFFSQTIDQILSYLIKLYASSIKNYFWQEKFKGAVVIS